MRLVFGLINCGSLDVWEIGGPSGIHNVNNLCRRVRFKGCSSRSRQGIESKLTHRSQRLSEDGIRPCL